MHKGMIEGFRDRDSERRVKRGLSSGDEVGQVQRVVTSGEKILVKMGWKGEEGEMTKHVRKEWDRAEEKMNRL